LDFSRITARDTTFIRLLVSIIPHSRCEPVTGWPPDFTGCAGRVSRRIRPHAEKRLGGNSRHRPAQPFTTANRVITPPSTERRAPPHRHVATWSLSRLINTGRNHFRPRPKKQACNFLPVSGTLIGGVRTPNGGFPCRRIGSYA
jgi:hypothetical protein